MSDHQISIRVGRSCDHRRRREKIYSAGGRVIAERCGGCHEIVQVRECKGCSRSFRLTEANAKHHKLYCEEACRRRAYRARRKQRTGAL